jgi:hypothetical protein
MPARKIPLVYSTPKEKHQQYNRYDPMSRTVVNIACVCTKPPEIVVGVGDGANTLLYSLDDGLSWKGLGNTIFDPSAYCAEWNGTMWVAGGTGSNALAYSYDGIKWAGIGYISAGPSTTVGSCISLVWTGSFWLGTDGTNVLKSTNGINWTGYSNIFTTGDIKTLSTNGNVILAVPTPNGTPTIQYSYDGITWTSVSDTNLINESILSYTDILYDGSKFIITVGLRSNPNNSKFYSTNGIAWTRIPNVAYVNGTNIGSKANSLYISRGTNPSASEISYNGTSWSVINNSVLSAFPIVIGVRGTIFSTSKNIIVCSVNTNEFVYSSDGVNWKLSSTFLPGKFVAGFSKFRF